MKKHACAFLITLFSLPAFAQVQVPGCGNDYNCYYQQLARTINQQRQQQHDELEAYRFQQLQLQEQQMEETQRQNDLIEEQLEIEKEQMAPYNEDSSVQEALPQ